MHGDIKLATLSDTDTTNAVGTELVDFSAASDWTISSSSEGSQSFSSGVLTVTNNDTSDPPVYVYQAITTVSGKRYVLTATAASGSSLPNFALIASVNTATSGAINNIGSSTWNVAGTVATNTFTATSATTYVLLRVNANAAGTNKIASCSARLAEEDRSVNGNGLQVFGTVTKTAVATGADLVGYKPNSSPSSNYFCINETNWSIGTGDFSISFWWNGTSAGDTTQIYLGIPSTGGSSPSGGFNIWTYGGLQKMYISGSYYDYTDSGLNKWSLKTIVRRSGWLYLYEDGVLQAGEGGASTGSINDQKFNVFYGHYGQSAAQGSLALLRISKTSPTAEQIKKIYNDEKFLFQENVKATLYGTSDAVTALAYDDSTELLHVGTSAGRSVFQGLRRVDNTTDAVGTSISASNGFIVED
jgi:hypothetical protein